MADAHEIVSHPFTGSYIRIKAIQLCRRSDFTRTEDEDLQQEMIMYLWKKSHLFDSLRGNIEAFVTTAVKSWVGMELRRRARLKRIGDFQSLMLDAVPRQCDLQRRTQQEAHNGISMVDLKDATGHAMNLLTSEERALLCHVAEHGVASASREKMISRRQVANAVAGMRGRFEDAGLGDL